MLCLNWFAELPLPVVGDTKGASPDGDEAIGDEPLEIDEIVDVTDDEKLE